MQDEHYRHHHEYEDVSADICSIEDDRGLNLDPGLNNRMAVYQLEKLVGSEVSDDEQMYWAYEAKVALLHGLRDRLNGRTQAKKWLRRDMGKFVRARSYFTNMDDEGDRGTASRKLVRKRGRSGVTTDSTLVSSGSREYGNIGGARKQCSV